MTKKYKTLICVYSDFFLFAFYAVLYLCASFNGTSIKILLCIALLLFALYVMIKLIFGIRNIVIAIKLALNNDSKTLFQLAKKTKYGSIWVFVINYIVNRIACYVVVLLLFHAAILALPYIGFIILMTYLDVIFTSCFGICFIILKKRKGEVSLKFAVLNVVLLLCFVFDIVDTIYISRKCKKILENIEV